MGTIEATFIQVCILVTWGHNLGHSFKLKKYLVASLEVTFFYQLTFKLVRMFVLMKSLKKSKSVTWDLKLGHWVIFMIYFLAL